MPRILPWAAGLLQQSCSSVSSSRKPKQQQQPDLAFKLTLIALAHSPVSEAQQGGRGSWKGGTVLYIDYFPMEQSCTQPPPFPAFLPARAISSQHRAGKDENVSPSAACARGWLDPLVMALSCTIPRDGFVLDRGCPDKRLEQPSSGQPQHPSGCAREGNAAQSLFPHIPSCGD